jgi:hypothetical protein
MRSIIISNEGFVEPVEVKLVSTRVYHQSLPTDGDFLDGSLPEGDRIQPGTRLSEMTSAGYALEDCPIG